MATKSPKPNGSEKETTCEPLLAASLVKLSIACYALSTVFGSNGSVTLTPSCSTGGGGCVLLWKFSSVMTAPPRWRQQQRRFHLRLTHAHLCINGTISAG